MPNIITFDMGGTSCDVALIRDGEPAVAGRGKIEGRDIAVPMMDINTVSAGGGTIAKVNELGEIEVGPQTPARCRARPTMAAASADWHGLQSGARLSQPRQLPRRPDAPRCRAGADSDRRLDRGAARHAGGAGGGRRDPHHRREDAGGHQGDLHHARPRSAGLFVTRLRGAGPLHAARIARELGMAASSGRSIRACSPPWG